MNNACDKSCACGQTSTPAPTFSPFLSAEGQWISRYRVPKMDCSSEERMIHLALEGTENVQGLRFDLPQRQVEITHYGTAEPITERLQSLGLGAEWQGTQAATDASTSAPVKTNDGEEARTLKWLLGINGAMFIVELLVGWWAQSTGLIADSLDMFADAAVYGLSLYAVGKTAVLKLRVAHLSGWFQFVLAAGVLLEVVRRFWLGSDPDAPWMIGMAFIALVANVSCLWLISRQRDSGAHMKASWIFSANDVMVNLGVIVAGILVAWTQSRYPDLIIGTAISFVVLNGARRILALKA